MYVKRRTRTVRPELILLAATVLGGCTSLPRNGPTGTQIARSATKQNAIGFKIVDIAPENIDTLSMTGSPTNILAALALAGQVDQIGPGDVLSVEIYEVGVTLFGGRAISEHPTRLQITGQICRPAAQPWAEAGSS